MDVSMLEECGARVRRNRHHYPRGHIHLRRIRNSRNERRTACETGVDGWVDGGLSQSPTLGIDGNGLAHGQQGFDLCCAEDAERRHGRKQTQTQAQTQIHLALAFLRLASSFTPLMNRPAQGVVVYVVRNQKNV
jgi:hypothetical protein